MPVLVLAAVRTPLGALGGGLRPLGAVHLGSLVIREALSRAELGAEPIDEVVMGCAFQAGLGPNPARQAALGAGLGPRTSAWTLNQLCGSGLMAVAQAARGLEVGQGRFAVAGGLESASNAPYLLPHARWGKRMGEAQLRDLLLQDGPAWFEDPAFAQPPAGSLPDPEVGLLALRVEGRRGVTVVDRDEACAGRPGQAPPADGAAALVLAREDAARGRRPLARILGFSTAETGALEHLASQAGLEVRNIHCFQGADVLRAAGGTPLLVDMIHALRRVGQSHGLATLSTGDGQNLSMLLELC